MLHTANLQALYMANTKLFVLLVRAASMSPWTHHNGTSDLYAKISYNELVLEP